MFSQKFSPTTGKMEWVVEDEDYDMRDEIGRSAYADMLHDDERNKKYYSATVDAIKRMKASNRSVKMLDIGTGTGLLAMMAAKSGADTVTACEAFPPIANAAESIVKTNSFEEKIKVVGKRSTDVRLGPGEDMDSKANLLVTELWDTELIGEGALPTLRDACKRLLEPDFVCVPAAGTIYSQVFSSTTLWNMHQLHPKNLSAKMETRLPEGMTNCAGTASPFDLHIDELEPEEITLLSKPTPVVRFDFCNNSLSENCPNVLSLPATQDKPENTTESHHASTTATCSGVAHGVVMWWSLDMDIDGKITIETAPKWAHPDGDGCQWRDHWMQAVYFLKKPLEVHEGQELDITCCHDDYSVWFGVQTKSVVVEPTARPICTCGAHITWSRHRHCMLNDRERNAAFQAALQKMVSEGCTRGLCIGDGSLLPLQALDAGFERVLSLESSPLFIKLLNKILELNNQMEKIKLLEKSVEQLSNEGFHEQLDVVISEPFFSASLFPWHNIHFWYAVTSIRRHVNKDIKVLPQGGTLRAMAVEFKDLWKYHAPVGVVEGFDVSHFDHLIQGSKSANEMMDGHHDNCIALEPHHVWEYPCKPLTQPFDIAHFDFRQPIPEEKIRNEKLVDFTRSGECQCVVLWMDFNLTKDLIITTGLPKASCEDDSLAWVRHTKQGVYFMRSPVTLAPGSVSKLSSSILFDPSLGDFSFHFEVL